MGLYKKFDTLFLDRDGVINKHLLGDYVKTIDEMEFLPQSLEALKILAPFFKHIIIVSNQRGVGKGVMSLNDLDIIHTFMQQKIDAIGGRIDKIYCCTDLDENSPNRKPNIGMAIQAKTDFPDIVFKQSIMVGDSLFDMLFARNAGMYAILINKEEKGINPEYFDEQYADLYSFAKKIMIDNQK